jgi:hypothetical protein
LQKKQDLAVLQTNGSGVLSFAGVSASAGQVIQVVTATDSTSRTTTSTSFVTGSNTLSVSITPSSASNKILIIATTTTRVGEDGANSFYTIYKNATNLGNSNGMSSHSWNAGDVRVPVAMTYLDSPSTTSAITYQVYFRSSTGTTYLNFNSSVTSITVMEIKG